MQDITHQLLTTKEGLNYLVPMEWWEDFIKMNKNITNNEQIQCPCLDLSEKVESFLLDFKDDLVSEFSQKNSNRMFNEVVISPQPVGSIDWKHVSPQLWKIIEKKTKSIGVLSYATSTWEVLPVRQIQIIFKSSSYTSIFIGFLTATVEIVPFVRAMAFHLGFTELSSSQILFPQKNASHHYYLQDLDKITISNLIDSFLIIINLSKQDQSYNFIDNQEDIGYEKANDFMNQSNEAVAGDIITMIDQSHPNGLQGVDQNIQKREVHFELMNDNVGQNENMENRIGQLLKQKNSEQIEELRKIAKKALSGQLIQIPKHNSQQMNEQLQILASDIVNGIELIKKDKTYTQEGFEESS